MKIILILLGYLKWHYGRALVSLSQVWGNFFYFINVFFSFDLLFKNFFDPWKRMADPYPKSLDLKLYLTVFITNSIVRIVGMIMRTFLIIVGLFAYLLLAVLYPVAVVFWLALPFLLIVVIRYSINLLIAR
jgi:hypothetical protein